MSDILTAYQTMRGWLESDGREMSDDVMEALTVVLEYAAVEHERLRARVVELEAAEKERLDDEREWRMGL